MRPSFRNQSAMEYLMTYRWAIIIVAIVLGALFSLGVFNASNFMPKAPPGSCHVFRPNGAGTTTNPNLVGTCGELPQFVAQFGDANNSTYITLPASVTPSTATNLTLVFWMKMRGQGIFQLQEPITTAADSSGYIQLFYYYPPCNIFYFQFYNGIAAAAPGSYSACPVLGSWMQYAVTYNGHVITGYTNGVPVGILNWNGGPIGNFITTGLTLGYGEPYNFNGLMADVQVYNASLDNASINTLYREGVGGAPIQLPNLVGWWPLNGDANDYSGNGNNGVPFNMSYNGSWTNGYTVP